MRPTNVGAHSGCGGLANCFAEGGVHRELDSQENASDDRAGDDVQQPRSWGPSTKISDSPLLSVEFPAPSLLCVGSRASTQAPTWPFGRLDHRSYDRFHDLRKEHGYRRKDAKRVLEARLASTGDLLAGSTRNTPATGAGKRGRPPADAADHLQGLTVVPESRAVAYKGRPPRGLCFG